MKKQRLCRLSHMFISKNFKPKEICSFQLKTQLHSIWCWHNILQILQDDTFVGGNNSTSGKSPYPYHRSTPANKYLFRVNSRNTRKRCEISSKLTIKTPKRCHWRHSGVFIVNINVCHTFSYCFYCWHWTRNCLLGQSPTNYSDQRKEIKQSWTKPENFDICF